MAHLWRLEKPRNEMDHTFSYAPGMPEREHLLQHLKALDQLTQEIPLIIGRQSVETGEIFEARCPHDHRHVLARAHQATEQELKWASEAALDAQEVWAGLDWYQHAAIFHRVAKGPPGKLMTEEIFGPVLTVYVYQDEAYEETLRLCDTSTPYGLTGAFFARDRGAIAQVESILRYAAGNFYINDKPTGAVVAHQPFDGARHSGTNDKAGFWLNVMRWLSPRTIKETLVPARDWRVPTWGRYNEVREDLMSR